VYSSAQIIRSITKRTRDDARPPPPLNLYCFTSCGLSTLISGKSSGVALAFAGDGLVRSKRAQKENSLVERKMEPGLRGI